MELPASANKENIDISDLPIREKREKTISPSEDAVEPETLTPCGVCGRTFAAKALERHMKICQNVSSKLPRKVYDVANIRTKDLQNVPRSMTTTITRKRSSGKAEDEFKACPICSRKFGPKVVINLHISFQLRYMFNSPFVQLVFSCDHY